MKFTIVVALALILLALVRRNLLQVDLSFPLFVSLILLGGRVSGVGLGGRRRLDLRLL